MKVVVIGGVAAGMSAAARLRRLDETAEIIVLERGSYVSFANCGLPYYVGGEIKDEAALLLQTPQSLKEALNLDVRIDHDVRSVDPVGKTVQVVSRGADGAPAVEQISYDYLVLTPGALPLKPPLPGLDLPHVHSLRTVDDAKVIKAVVGGADAQGADVDGVKKPNATVLGAGFIGIEAAEALANRGWNVTLVELAPHVLPPVEDELCSIATRELERLGIEVRTGVAATAVTEEHVLLSDGSEVPAQLVVLSIGVRPDLTVAKGASIETRGGAIVVDANGKTNVPGIWAAGDATVLTSEATPASLAGPANRGGRVIADDIFATENASTKTQTRTLPGMPKPLRTAIVRVGETTVAMTGKNRRALEGTDYFTVHLHPNQHAGYFPGAKPISLLVHFGADGKVLGAQAAGPDGTDKRIDILATAIRAGMNANDLIDLDLAYAPPYGSAKDPVNMAGMIAQNVIDGQIRLWYPDDLEWAIDHALIIDVRTYEEFADGHIPGALNIAHTEIREHLDEIREAAAGRPVRLICKSGYRSYLAYRALVPEGYDVATFSGGMMTLVDTFGDSLHLETGAGRTEVRP